LKINLLTPNDLQRRRAVSPLKIKIPSKNIREKPTNTPIIPVNTQNLSVTKTVDSPSIQYAEFNSLL
jgi:hypothetical protein